MLSRSGRRCLVVIAMAMWQVDPRPAHAEPSGNAGAAQLLFDEAKALVAKGKLSEACPKFVASHRLDRAGGTILHAAYCHEAEGKVATAWTEYNEALSMAVRDRRADRERFARERIGALGPRLAKLSLEVTAEAAATEGLAVELDGAALARAAWDAAIPVDAGDHVLAIKAPGHAPRLERFSIVDGAKQTLAIRPPEPEIAIAPPTDRGLRVDMASEDPGGDRRLLALALGGGGALGIGLGAIFGARALSIGDQSARCTLGPTGNGCPPEAVADQDDARAAGTVATVGFVAGGALLVAAGVVWFTAPRAGARATFAPSPSAHGGSLVVHGEF